MAINKRAYNTNAYEVGAISDSTTVLPPGTPCKITGLPVSPIKTPDDQYFKIAAAGAGDEVNGVVSMLSSSISDSVPGRMVMKNVGLIPVLLAADLMAGDKLKPIAGGKFDKAATGDVAHAKLVESGKKDELAWARPIEEKL